MDMPRQELIRSLSALEPQLREEGVTRLVLFGSRARGDNRPESDVDVAIDVGPGSRFSMLDLVGVAHHIEDCTGLNANVFMRRSLEPDFVRTLLRDGIEVFG